MTFEQITTLLDKGFTPEQICTLTNSVSTPTTDTDKADHEQGDTSVLPSSEGMPPVMAADTNQEPAAPVIEDHSKDILDAIKDLKAAVQAKNISTLSVDTISQDDTLEKAMAEFIRPSFGKEEK